MKRGSTVFLTLVLLLIAGFVLTWLLVFPHFEGRNTNANWFQIYFQDPFLAYVYLAFVPFFAGIYQALKLLGLIEKNKVFSPTSVQTLQNITYCALAFAGLIGAIGPFIAFFGERDNPGVALIPLIMAFASVAVATAAGVFKKLLQNAVDIKSENDLTV